MKKILLIPFILFCATSLFAGEFSATGLKLGMHQSRFVGKDIPGKGASNIPGVAIGGFLTYNINRKIAIRQELFISTRGSQINTVGDINLHNVFVYLECPLLAKYSFLPESRFGPFIFAGPDFSINLLAINDVGMPDDIRKTDWGVIAGVGVEFWRVGLELRFYRGLSDFDQSASGIDLKNQSFSFLFSYSFFAGGGE